MAAALVTIVGLLSVVAYLGGLVRGRGSVPQEAIASPHNVPTTPAPSMWIQVW